MTHGTIFSPEDLYRIKNKRWVRFFNEMLSLFSCTHKAKEHYLVLIVFLLSVLQAPLTLRKALLFWIPLTVVKQVQVISRPMINLVVSRTLSDTVGETEAAKV